MELKGTGPYKIEYSPHARGGNFFKPLFLGKLFKKGEEKGEGEKRGRERREGKGKGGKGKRKEGREGKRRKVK